MIFSFDRFKASQKRKELEKLKKSNHIIQALREGGSLFARYGVKRAVLYGSVMEKRVCDSSDVDILITDIEAEKYFALILEIEELLGRRVDLRTNDGKSEFARKITERGIVIYGG